MLKFSFTFYATAPVTRGQYSNDEIPLPAPRLPNRVRLSLVNHAARANDLPSLDDRLAR